MMHRVGPRAAARHSARRLTLTGGWYMAEEGKIKALVDSSNIDPNPDPNAWPTPKQFFCLAWPWVAGTVAMLFDSVAAKFATTSDMKFLCTTALNDDIKATTALCILAAPAEHSVPFVRAIAETGALARIREIVAIYKTLPREQHDETLTNACVIASKVAADPELRSQGLPIGDFLWMMPAGPPQLYTTYGAEGVAHLWMSHPAEMLAGGGVGNAAGLAEGVSLSNLANLVTTELAARLLDRFGEQREALLSTATELEARLGREVRAAGAGSGRKNLWQATGVLRGETEVEVARREQREQLAAVQSARQILQAGAMQSTIRTPLDE